MQEFGDSDAHEKVYVVCSVDQQAKDVISIIKAINSALLADFCEESPLLTWLFPGTNLGWWLDGF